MTEFLANLRLPQKLSLIAVMAALLVAVPMGLYVSRVLQVVASTQAELDGLNPSHQLLDVIRLTQQHRGQSANVLSGNAAAVPQRAAVQAQLEKAVAQFGEIATTQIDNARVRADWSKLHSTGDTLVKAVAAGAVSVADSASRHTALIADLIDLHDRVLDHHGLTLDPEADAYFLIISALQQMPRLTEILGQARARGSVLLVKQTGTPEERIAVSGLGDRAQSTVREMDVGISKAFEARPEFKAALGGKVDKVRADTETLIKLVRERIVSAPTLDYPAGDYFATSTRIIDEVYALILAVDKELERHLNERKAAQIRESVSVGGAIAAVAVIALWIGMVIARSIIRSADQARAVAQRIAAGDLTGTVTATSRDEMGQMLGALAEMQAALTQTVQAVRRNADSVATASAEIAQGNNDLSQRNEQQAAALEETAASMEEMGTTVANNADNAKRANELAADASAVAGKGGEVVSSVVQTMKQMHENSRKISDIISVIDGIAFQTNILALNAAVEAARAGDQGRGFAVVASEVRSLAQRSAEAAKEIKTLITASVDQVERGTALADRAGLTMQEVVVAVGQVSTMMAEISSASDEQSAGIGQVSQAVGQLDQATQQNAALVEESAAAAESLRHQAVQLVETVAAFKLA